MPTPSGGWPSPATRAAAPLGRAHLVVADGGHGPIQGRLVVAGVVRPSGGREVGELADEVAAAQLDRVHPEAAGELVHGALDREGRLRPARAAVGGGRRGAGQDGADPRVHAGGPVGAGRHRAGGARDRGAGVRVGADIGVHQQLVGEQLAIPCGGQPGLLLLTAAARRGGQRLGAVLGPAHRPAEQPGQVTGEHVLRIRRALGPERAAGHRHHHPHLVGLEPERRGQAIPEPVLGLVRHPDGEPAVVVGAGQDGAGLQRRGDQELLPVAGLDHDRGGSEHVVDRRAELPVGYDVGPAGEQRQCPRLGGLFRAEQRRQGLQHHDDVLGAVLGERP